MKLEYDETLSKFAFKFNLRHYTKAKDAPAIGSVEEALAILAKHKKEKKSKKEKKPKKEKKKKGKKEK